MKISRAFAVALIAWASAAPAAEPAARVRLADHLPADTLYYLDVPSLAAFEKVVTEGIIGRFLAVPEIQQALGPLLEQAKGLQAQFLPQGLAKIGLTPEDLPKLLGGGISMAMPDVIMGGQQPVPRILMSLDVAGTDEEVWALVERVVAAIRAQDEEAVELGDAQDGIRPLRIGDAPFVASRAGGTLVLSLLPEDLTAIRDRVKSGGKVEAPLSAAACFQRCAKAVGGSSLAIAYANVKRILDLVAKSGEATEEFTGIANLLGAPAIEGLALGLSWEKGDGLATMYLDFPNGRQGAFAIPSETKLDPAILDRVPANAFFAWSCGWDLAGVWDRILGLAGSVPPLKGGLDETLPEFEKAIGVKIPDLLAPIGSSQVSWLAFPPDGGLIPDDLGAMKLKDPAGFMKAIAAATASLGGVIRKVPAGQKTMTIVEIPVIQASTTIAKVFDESTPSAEEVIANVGENPMAAAFVANLSTQLALALDGDILLSANSPLALKRYLASRSAPGAKGLASDPFFQKTTAGRLAGQNAFVYMRMDPALARLYGAVVPLIQTFGGGPLRRMLGADVAQLPTPEFIEKIFSGCLITCRVDPNAIELKASSGGTGLVALGAVAGLAAVGFARAAPAPVWIEGVEPPTPEEKLEEPTEEPAPEEKADEPAPEGKEAEEKGSDGAGLSEMEGEVMP